MISSSRVLPFSSARPFAQASAPVMDLGGEPFCLMGPSEATARLWSQLQTIGPHFRTALLMGETGTGAEFAARVLHGASPFRDRMLRVLGPAEAEAVLGAGGVPERTPIYVAELEQLSRVAQKGLLRLVRLRGARAGCVIAFARQDLRALVSAGSFSGELATALGGLRLMLPPLRERREDIAGLMQAVNTRTARELGCAEALLEADFLEAAREFAWPRNLEQMGEMMAWLLRQKTGGELRREDFEAACEACEPKLEASAPTVRMVPLEEMVQEHIRAVLLACHGNKLRAAEVLGISRSTLYRMLDAAAAEGLLARAG